MRATFLLIVAAFLLSGCASSGPPLKPNEREWNAISAQYEALETLRRSSAPPSSNASRKEQIEALLELHKRIEPSYIPLMETVREYFDRTADPRAAQLYAREKIRMGDEYMNVLSRFDRAAGMYQSALAIDPANDEAKQRLQLAQARRFVTLDTFSVIRSGMKEEEVRKLVGMPREDWIKQVIQNSRVYSVWIYPKTDGGASAIYFDNGLVYHTNWNASPAPEQKSN